jgi:hypothetical protein
VTTETTRFLGLLEQRIALLGSLAESLVAARTDVVSLDITGLESRIAHQEHLCTDIRSLDSQLDRLQRQCAAHLSVPSEKSLAPGVHSESQRMREILARLQAAQSSVQQLNDAHQALLRRSRRTVGALLNSLHSFAMVYSDPSAARETAGERV